VGFLDLPGPAKKLPRRVGLPASVGLSADKADASYEDAQQIQVATLIRLFDFRIVGTRSSKPVFSVCSRGMRLAGPGRSRNPTGPKKLRSRNPTEPGIAQKSHRISSLASVYAAYERSKAGRTDRVLDIQLSKMMI